MQIQQKLRRMTAKTPKNRYRSVTYKVSKGYSSSFRAQTKKEHSQEKNHEKAFNLPIQLKRVSRSSNQFQKKTKQNEMQKEYRSFRNEKYLASFHSIMDMEQSRKQKIQGLITERPRQKLRVYLPVIVQNSSHFTILDNIHLPISYISIQIDKAKEKMKAQVENIKKIKSHLFEIQKKVTDQIEETQKIGKNGFQKLWAMLNSDRVAQQQIHLKLKSSFESSKQYLPEYYKSFEKSKKDCKDLQETIFTMKPFELKQTPQFEAISSSYF